MKKNNHTPEVRLFLANAGATVPCSAEPRGDGVRCKKRATRVMRSNSYVVGGEYMGDIVLLGRNGVLEDELTDEREAHAETKREREKNHADWLKEHRMRRDYAGRIASLREELGRLNAMLEVPPGSSADKRQALTYKAEADEARSRAEYHRIAHEDADARLARTEDALRRADSLAESVGSARDRHRVEPRVRPPHREAVRAARVVVGKRIAHDRMLKKIAAVKPPPASYFPHAREGEPK